MFLSCLQLCTLHSEVLHCFRAVECCVRSALVTFGHQSSSVGVCILKIRPPASVSPFFFPPLAFAGCFMSAMGIASTTWGRRPSSSLSHTWTNSPSTATRPTRRRCTASSVPCSSPKATTMRYVTPAAIYLLLVEDCGFKCSSSLSGVHVLESIFPTFFPGVQVVHRSDEGDYSWAACQSSRRCPPTGLQGEQLLSFPFLRRDRGPSAAHLC